MKINIRHNSPWGLPLVFLLSATVMLVYEGFKEMIFHGSLSPWQSHALTIFITSLIATLAASVVRTRVNTIAMKEQSLLSFRLVMSAVNHIVNNALNYIRLIRMELDSDGKVREDTLHMLEASLLEAEEQMKILNRIEEPDRPESYRNIFPQ